MVVPPIKGPILFISQFLLSTILSTLQPVGPHSRQGKAGRIYKDTPVLALKISLEIPDKST